ncbi:hypothetical protein [Kallipyga massiliensis]|uniref:hypothetical protein n=1 Tax=Kallipyga massiliensis TaxID=1472764 RepID=UPI0012B52060|nr:hypothetical protein [Kallipyga massiliensis]
MLKFFLGHGSDKRNNKETSKHSNLGYIANRDFREPVRMMIDFGGVIVISPLHAVNQ